MDDGRHLVEAETAIEALQEAAPVKASVRVTAAEIKNLVAAPKTLIPGEADALTVVVAFAMRLRVGAAAYDAVDARRLDVGFADTSNGDISGDLAWLDSPTDVVAFQGYGGQGISGNAADLVGKDVVLKASTADDMTGGDGTLEIALWFFRVAF